MKTNHVTIALIVLGGLAFGWGAAAVKYISFEHRADFLREHAPSEWGAVNVAWATVADASPHPILDIDISVIPGLFGWAALTAQFFGWFCVGLIITTFVVLFIEWLWKWFLMRLREVSDAIRGTGPLTKPHHKP